MKLRKDFINENIYRLNSFKYKQNKFKKDIPLMNFKQKNDYFNKLYGSIFLKSIKKLINDFTDYSAFQFCCKILDFDYYFINDLEAFTHMFKSNYILNFYLDDEFSCHNCSFTHFSYNILLFQKKYPLLTLKQINNIFNECKKGAPLRRIPNSP